MQGTQYAPRESILCMEHFVALQCTLVGNEIRRQYCWRDRDCISSQIDQCRSISRPLQGICGFLS